MRTCTRECRPNVPARQPSVVVPHTKVSGRRTTGEFPSSVSMSGTDDDPGDVASSPGRREVDCVPTMTANAVVSPLPSQDSQQQGEEPLATMVRLVRDSFAVVEPQADKVAQHFYATLFAIAPATREMFPVNMQVQRSRLL